ncbi:MAG: hypothetical protein MRY32_00605 [Rickettsiales bacterium]|nr:hypothetical protein [Rickettsiales bacterium]
MAEKAAKTDDHYSDYVNTTKIADATLRQKVECVLDMFWADPECRARIRQGFKNTQQNKMVFADIAGHGIKYHHAYNVTTLNELPLGKGGFGDAMYPILNDDSAAPIEYHDYSLNRLIAHEVLGHWGSDTFNEERNISGAQILQDALLSLYKIQDTDKLPDDAKELIDIQSQLDQLERTSAAGGPARQMMAQSLLTSRKEAYLELRTAVIEDLGITVPSFNHQTVLSKLKIVEKYETATIEFTNRKMAELFGEPPRDPTRYNQGKRNRDGSPGLDVVGFAPGKAPKGYVGGCPFVKDEQAKLDIEAIRGQTDKVALAGDGTAKLAAPSNDAKIHIS